MKILKKLLLSLTICYNVLVKGGMSVEYKSKEKENHYHCLGGFGGVMCGFVFY